MQRRASQLYNALIEKRCNLTQKLNDGVQNVALLQNQLISDRLYVWKNRQKLQQVGVPFEERDRLIDEIQVELVLLPADHPDSPLPERDFIKLESYSRCRFCFLLIFY